MKKVILEFIIGDKYDEQAAKRAQNADAAYGALWTIGQEVFRPARKHGYSDSRIQELLTEGSAVELVSLLEQKFYEILENTGVNLDDYS